MTDKEPTLGDELNRLEEIVRRLEDDDLALEAALELFEEGVGRLKGAKERLSEAETRVMEVLKESAADGGLELKPLDG